MSHFFHHLITSELIGNAGYNNDSYVLDTCDLAKGCVKNLELNKPDNYKLLTLYQSIYNRATSDLGDSAHRAEADVHATCCILLYERFWAERHKYMYKINIEGIAISQLRNVIPQTITKEPNDDSDTDKSCYVDVEELDDDVSLPSSCEDIADDEELLTDNVTEPTLGWSYNSIFEGEDANPKYVAELKAFATRSPDNDNSCRGLKCEMCKRYC